MPMLDVAFMAVDPMFADRFNLSRRAEAIDSHGRPSLTTTSFNNLIGVITQEDPSTLTRDDDSENVPRVISVVSKFAMRGATLGFQPDLITWNGTNYLVTSVKTYSRFGAGFYEASCSSMALTDTPQ